MASEIPLGSVALALAEAGTHVFPCLPGQKRPATRRGFHAATRDRATIRRWWQRVPAANVGVSTGPSDLVVVDCDAGKPWPLSKPRPAGVANGLDVIDWIAEEMGEPVDFLWSSPTVSTPSGGAHLYFRQPEGQRFRSRANVMPWVDVRADGGYVVGPFSQLPHGHYLPVSLIDVEVLAEADQEVRARGVPEVSISLDAPPLPRWLAEILALQETPRRPVDDVDAIRAALERPAIASASRYGETALAREADRVRSAANGSRNAALNDAAFRLGTLVGAGVLDEAEVTRQLHDAALAAGLDEHEIGPTMTSGLRSGMANPRTVAP